ncbi:TM2 domain-containing protein [Sphingomonas sp.]|uniref:TM2 domain-containing protein n=1 Tax=Sphingomonas sp. TaxID=28214 RepID=UPI002DD68F1F|nr:TM2 domain-containing protein [Sphingomonas sp.]
MRGQVLGVDRVSGDGQIAGDDGRRYRFRPEDWGDKTGPSVGAQVDFETSETRALSIYRVPATTPVTLHEAPQQPSRQRSPRNKVAAALLAFFVGVFGVHRFYLGRTGSGIAMLVLTCTFFGLVVTGLWAFIDFIRYLVMPEDEFDARYNRS